MLKRISAIALALVFSLSCLVIPSFALESSDGKYYMDMYHETTQTVEVLAECQPAFVFVEDIGVFMLDEALGLADGETYKVNWNGVEYSCVAEDEVNASTGEVTNTNLGNVAVMDGSGDTGEPFVIAAVYNEGMTVIMPLDGSTELTISISIKQKAPDPPISVLDIFGAILTPVWRIFTETPVPGLGISFAELLLAQILIGIAIAVLRSIGVGGDGTSYRSGSNKSARISEERKGDEF